MGSNESLIKVGQKVNLLLLHLLDLNHLLNLLLLIQYDDLSCASAKDDHFPLSDQMCGQV